MIYENFIKGCQPFESDEWPAILPNYIAWLDTDLAIINVEAQPLIDR